MGYYVDYNLDDVKILAKNIPACLAAINNLHTDKNLTENAGGGKCGTLDPAAPMKEVRWYMWVRNPAGYGFTDLIEAFDAWRFEAEEDNSDIIIFRFRGEKLGDENILFNAIAPFVESGGTIDARGEDGALWRHEFKDGKLETKNGRIVYG